MSSIQESPRLSASQEDYLKAIRQLGRDLPEVRITDLAAAMGLSKASTHRAMQHLKEAGMVTQEHYGSITLTEDGAAYAESIAETYKVVYRFLTEVLDVDEETAGREAHLIEHDISKDTRKKLKKLTKKKK